MWGKPWTEAASARPKLIAITVAVMAIVAGVASAAPGARAASDLRHVLFVGNNWDGTATVVRPRGDFAALGEVNIIPDIDERMLEIATNPERLGYFLAVRELIGEGHDQFVDDMFTSNDGRC